ncbi:MAG TPA: hypothetical protein VJH90_04395 [archaeon]|nr:hypothetical protein [archaeon]
MTDLLIAFLNLVGTLGFLLAFAYSYKNYRMTRFISSTWLLLSLSMVILAIFFSMNILQWLDIDADLFDQIQNALMPVAIFSLIVSIIVFEKEPIRPNI